MEMELLKRYLQAIGRFLPAGTKADTLAELRTNLLEQMDARAEELGRPLTQTDAAAILKAHGKPEVVASRYLPQRWLIGPTVFPFYMLTLKRVQPVVLLVNVIARGIQLVTSQGESWEHFLESLALGAAASLLISAAIITIIFGMIERSVRRGKEWKEWDPAKLPAATMYGAEGCSPKSTIARVIDLVLYGLFMAYALWVPWHPFWLMGPAVFYFERIGVRPAPVLHTYYLMFLAVLALQLVLKLIAILPAAQSKLELLKLATDLLGTIPMGMLAWSSTYFVTRAPVWDPQQSAAMNQAAIHSITVVNQSIATANHLLNLGFRIAFVLGVMGFAMKVWKYVKRCAPAQRLAF